MLVVKVYVNYRQIDEIHIINTGHKNRGRTLYQIVQPAGLSHVPIWHKRENGWQKLVTKALRSIQKQT